MPTRDELTARRGRPSAAVEAKVARLGRGRDLKTRCTWPGGTLEFDLCVLTQAERAEAEAEARRVLEARGVDLATRAPIVLEAVLVEQAVHVLAASMRDTGGGPLFTSAAELAEVATEDEIERLTDLYARHRAHNDPGIDSLTADEVAEIEECIKKKDPIRLSAIASSMHPRCLPTLVAMLAIALTGRSSSTHSSPAPSPTEASEPQPTEHSETSAPPNASA